MVSSPKTSLSFETFNELYSPGIWHPALSNTQAEMCGANIIITLTHPSGKKWIRARADKLFWSKDSRVSP